MPDPLSRVCPQSRSERPSHFHFHFLKNGTTSATICPVPTKPAQSPKTRAVRASTHRVRRARLPRGPGRAWGGGPRTGTGGAVPNGEEILGCPGVTRCHLSRLYLLVAPTAGIDAVTLGLSSVCSQY